MAYLAACWMAIGALNAAFTPSAGHDDEDRIPGEQDATNLAVRDVDCERASTIATAKQASITMTGVRKQRRVAIPTGATKAPTPRLIVML